MSFSNAAMLLAAAGLRSAIKGIALHNDNPGNGGAANKCTSAAQLPSWTTPSADGDFALSVPLGFTGVAANGAVTWVSLWSSTDLSTATWYGNFALSGDLTADSNGNYTLETFTVDGTAT